MYDTVLVATDGSDTIDRAVAHATDIAARYDADLHAIGVIDRRVYVAADEETRDEVRDSLTATAESAVASVAETAAAEDVGTTTHVADGVPHREIVTYAEETDADLVVVGTHGRTGRDRHVSLGSVSERVVEAADRPVLVVHIDDAS